MSNEVSELNGGRPIWAYEIHLQSGWIENGLVELCGVCAGRGIDPATGTNCVYCRDTGLSIASHGRAIASFVEWYLKSPFAEKSDGQN